MFFSITLLQLASLHRRAVLGAAALPFSPWWASASLPLRCCLVAGATGRMGREVVDALRREPNMEVIAGVRSEAARVRVAPDVPVLSGFDLTSDDPSFSDWLAHSMLRRGVTDVICTVGYSPTFVPSEDRRLAAAVDNDGTRRLIAAAETIGLSGRFVLVSSLGIARSTESARLLDSSLGGVLGQKAAAEASLRMSKLDWCVVRPGLLQKEVRQGELLLGGEVPHSDRTLSPHQQRRSLHSHELPCVAHEY